MLFQARLGQHAHGGLPAKRWAGASVTDCMLMLRMPGAHAQISDGAG